MPLLPALLSSHPLPSTHTPLFSWFTSTTTFLSPHTHSYVNRLVALAFRSDSAFLHLNSSFLHPPAPFVSPFPHSFVFTLSTVPPVRRMNMNSTLLLEEEFGFFTG
ncbi:unnamed protein product [Calicophoron daubneyi]|uniref:Uncharacterized protein n=1 Tax=Calicophoron daubneyi TaxID=300641 RepID=A0AAV2TTL3_CALDB